MPNVRRKIRVLTLRSARSPVISWLQLVAGLAIYGLSVSLMIRSELGLGPWDAFHVGIHNITGLSVGVASILVGVAIVMGSIFIGVRPGAGTLANMILIGVFIDIFLPVVPVAPGIGYALGMFACGIALCALATGMYIAAGLGKGPRDGLMIGISQRTTWRVGRARTGIEAIVLLCGWLMGGMVGLGTILFAVTIGPATQWGLAAFGISSTGVLSRKSTRVGRVRRAA
jgi:uncharacterized protein